MGVSRSVLQAVCLALGALMCWGPDQVTALSGYKSNNHRSRLVELLSIASHLEDTQNGELRQKRTFLDDMPNFEAQFGLRQTESSNSADSSFKALSRKRRGNGMDTFKSTYSLFYNKIVTFVDELKPKLKDDAPQELQYITLIPAILPLDDPAFITYNEDSVVQKALLVTEVTKFVLEKIGQYVVDSEKSWFDNQAAELQVYMSIVFSGLVNLRISDDQTPIQDLPTGIGGINAGLAYYDATDLQPLQDMINVLDQGT